MYLHHANGQIYQMYSSGVCNLHKNDKISLFDFQIHHSWSYLYQNLYRMRSSSIPDYNGHHHCCFQEHRVQAGQGSEGHPVRENPPPPEPLGPAAFLIEEQPLSLAIARQGRVAAPSIRCALLASCWPLPQQRLPVSATGGGRRCCPYRGEPLAKRKSLWGKTKLYGLPRPLLDRRGGTP